MTFENLLIGGSGKLGSEIALIDKTFYSPKRSELDIENPDSIRMFFSENKSIRLILNCAAFTDTIGAERNPGECFSVNMVGPFNIAKYRPDDCRFVHISTDYVFDGEDGLYSVEDKINPISNYARSKAAAEMVVLSFSNTLIIRTSFFPREFPHSAAFDDQWTSKGFVDEIAPIVLEETLSDRVGLCHVGMSRRSVYEAAKQRSPEVKRIKRSSVLSEIKIPRDTSLLP